LTASCADAIGADRMARAVATPNFKQLRDMILLRSNKNQDG